MGKARPLWPVCAVPVKIAGMQTKTISRVSNSLGRELLSFAAYVWRRFKHDDGLRVATALSYTTLLALVPLAAIGLAVLSAFPVFDDIRAELLLDLYSSVLPATQVEIARYFEDLVGNARQLTVVGVLALAATALMLLSTIVNAMNRIWRVVRPRPFALRFLVYWAVLTFGPLLFGASLTLTDFLHSTADTYGVSEIGARVPFAAYMVPLAMEIAGFSLLYLVVPNARVDWRHALAGGLVAMILFEALKYGFGFYVSSADSYETVYGALAALPIVLIWLYLIWAVLLIGAEVTASIPEWRDARVGEVPHTLSGVRRLMVALSLLASLADFHRRGVKARGKELVATVPAAPTVADAVLRQLAEGGFAEEVRRDRWMLARDLAHASLYELIVALHLDVDGAQLPKPRAAAPWTAPLKDILLRAEADREARMDIAIRGLLAGGPSPGSGEQPIVGGEEQPGGEQR